MSRRDQAIFVALAVLLVVLSFFSNTSARRDAQDLRPSSYLASPGGTAGLFLALEELGLDPERRLTPYVDADSLRGPLALLAPSQDLSPAELHALAQWIRAGGTLIYAGRMDDPTLDTLRLETIWAGPERMSSARRAAWTGRQGVPVAHALTEGMREASGFRYAFREPDSIPMEPLLRSEEGVLLAAHFPFGLGRVVAFSDPRPLVNQAVAGSGAGTIFARAAALYGGRVVFDEYHHGFRAGGNAAVATLRYLRDTRLGHALVQVAVAVIGLLLLVGTRLGSPRPPPPARRRDPLEHVRALAEAYRRAGARRTARRLLLHGLLRRLGRPAAGADGERVFETLRRATPAHAHDGVDSLAEEWAKGDHASLVTLARQTDRIVMETRRER